MLLVVDRDNNLSIHASVRDAERHLETIDVEDGEYQFCDESGQPYMGEVLKPVGKFSSGQCRMAHPIRLCRCRLSRDRLIIGARVAD